MAVKCFYEIVKLNTKCQKNFGVFLLVLCGVVLAFAPGGNTYRDPLHSEKAQLIKNFPYGDYEFTIEEYNTIKKIGNELFSVIDLRNEEDFNKGHLSDAENLPISYISPKVLSDYQDSKILFIDKDGVKAAQFMVITRLIGLDTYYIKEGMESLKPKKINTHPNSFVNNNINAQKTDLNIASAKDLNNVALADTKKPVKKKKKKKKRKGCD